MKYRVSWSVEIEAASKDEARIEAARILMTEMSAQDLNCEAVVTVGWCDPDGASCEIYA